MTNEKAVSKSQQRFMGMVHAVQKGEADASDFGPSVRKAAKSMKKKDVKDFAETKHKGLPNHVDESKNKKRIIRLTESQIKEIVKLSLLNEWEPSDSVSAPFYDGSGAYASDPYDDDDYHRLKEETINETFPTVPFIIATLKYDNFDTTPLMNSNIMSSIPNEINVKVNYHYYETYGGQDEDGDPILRTEEEEIDSIELNLLINGKPIPFMEWVKQNLQSAEPEVMELLGDFNAEITEMDYAFSTGQEIKDYFYELTKIMKQ